ncbi:hypothetical protein [Raoultella sp. BIGb0138]|uniref:hypothetical protein n=1 Tax=Raoultella sp. BIGb0138 TaxID=2485115 RepID=UPI0010535314|nr:hypothetical protein [Raoultella sp. BIGb0138]
MALDYAAIRRFTLCIASRASNVKRRLSKRFTNRTKIQYKIMDKVYPLAQNEIFRSEGIVSTGWGDSSARRFLLRRNILIALNVKKDFIF